jgi:hypothetical protein
MKTSKFLFSCCILAFALNLELFAQQDTPVIIHAGTLLDGQGHVLHNQEIIVQSGKILRVQPSSGDKGASAYDLRRLTVMPGWIDVHDHITWHFGPNGRVEDKSESAGQAALAAAGNAYATLMAGFTTIQSLASPEDKDLRAAIDSGRLPGPRLLTALNPIEDAKLTPDQIREAVRKLKADGADVVRRATARGLRRSHGSGSAQCGARVPLRGASGGRGRLHRSGAWNLRDTGRSGCDGQARDFLRSADWAGHPQLPGQQTEISGSWNLH